MLHPNCTFNNLTDYHCSMHTPSQQLQTSRWYTLPVMILTGVHRSMLQAGMPILIWIGLVKYIRAFAIP